MEVIDPREFISGPFREASFREAVRQKDWKQLQGKPVLIQGCSLAIPTWAYLILALEAAPFAKSISYGELKNPIPVLGQLGAQV